MGEPVELLEDADIDIREGEGINSQVFGRFLLGRGSFAQDSDVGAPKGQQRGERLGDLAVNQGFLSREEVGKVLDNQVDSVQALGGWQSARVLSVNQVNSLLVLQRRSKGGIGDALVALGHVSQEDMDRFFAEFEATQEPQRPEF